MTGGPGCSSELAVFFENGPYNIVKDGEEGGYSLKETKYGWDRTHTTIFVDQVGAGKGDAGCGVRRLSSGPTVAARPRARHSPRLHCCAQSAAPTC
jgi:hypothetical protein